MCSSVVITVCFIALLGSAVIGAPVSDKDSDIHKRSANPPSDTPDQEKDLQDLLSLVHKESNQNGVAVHKEQVSHFENNNGEKIQVQAKEEKVVDAKSGKLIADVKQEVKQESAAGSSAPEIVVKTKVDIPDEGVHETFVQGGQEDGDGDIIRGQEMESDLTPADMAEYLYATQRFPAFYAALERLVNQSKMSPGEAEMYTKAVAIEYEKLQLADFEGVLNEKRVYPPMSQESEVFALDSDAYPPVSPYFRDTDRYGPGYQYGYPAEYTSPEEQLALQQQQQQDSYNNIDPYEFFSALWNEAFGKGNEEAQEIVKMLYDRVSQDDNPDDMGQIRDLLAETILSSMNDDSDSYNEEEEEEVQQANSDIPAAAEVEKKLQVDSKVEPRPEVKPAEAKPAVKTEQKEGKAKIPVGNKPAEQKQ